jgi:trehalose synthase
MWKGKPVIGSAVGGIPTQIIPNLTGMLVHSIEGAAYQIRYLLSHPEMAKQLGDYGHEYVKERFLITRNLKRYLLLFSVLSYPGERIVHL